MKLNIKSIIRLIIKLIVNPVRKLLLSSECMAAVLFIIIMSAASPKICFAQDKNMKIINMTAGQVIREQQADASDYENYDYSDIDSTLKDAGYDGSFKDILKIIYSDYKTLSDNENGSSLENMNKSGKTSISDKIIKIMDEIIGNTFRSNKAAVLQIILLSVFSAAVKCFAPSFNKDQVSELAQLIISLALISILLASFAASCKISADALNLGINTYKAVIPVFFTTVAAASGNITAAAYYDVVLILITFVNMFFKNILLPFNKIYVVFSMSDSITGKEYFSKAAALVPSAVKISCKAAVVFFTGLGGIKAMAAPAADSVKRKLFYKAVQSIPVIGGSLDTVGQTVIGAGTIIKNGIGTAAIIVIIIICSIPILKLVVFSGMLKITAAAVEPVADKMIVKAVSTIADVIGLMALIVITAAGLFILITAVICMA